jgi:hypothetical protein
MIARPTATLTTLIAHGSGMRAASTVTPLPPRIGGYAARRAMLAAASSTQRSQHRQVRPPPRLQCAALSGNQRFPMLLSAPFVTFPGLDAW